MPNEPHGQPEQQTVLFRNDIPMNFLRRAKKFVVKARIYENMLRKLDLPEPVWHRASGEMVCEVSWAGQRGVKRFCGSCGRSVGKKRRFCPGCSRQRQRESTRTSSRRRYHELKRAGICSGCGVRASEPGKVRCRRCSSKEREQRRADYRRFKKEGVCPRCREERATGGRALCRDCRISENARCRSFYRKKRAAR